MKKILAILLAVVWSVSPFSSMVYAETNESVQTVKISEKHLENFNKLKAFGILTGYDEDDLSKNDAVTRGEFAIIAAAMLGNETDITVITQAPFADVTESDSYANALVYLKNKGIVAGSDNDSYEPEREISFAEASKILVNILGYSLDAEAKGGYPEGYLTSAQQIGLHMNVSNKDVITLCDAVDLLWSATKIEILSVGGISNGNFTLVGGKDATFLTEYMGIYKAEGTVEANQYTALIGAQAAGDEQVLISGTVFEDPDNVAQDYIGYNVDFYYHETEYGDYEIVWMQPCSDVDVISVREKDIIISDPQFSALKFVYAENNRVKRVNLAQDVNVIYNNENRPGYGAEFQDLFEIEIGDVTLVSNSNKNVYDTVIIHDYTTYVVDNTDTINNAVTDKTDKYVELEVNGESDEVIWEFNDGNGTGLADVSEYDILSVISSGKYMKVFVSSAFVKGTPENIVRDEETRNFVTKQYLQTVTINGVVYNVSRGYDEDSGFDTQPYIANNKEGIFSLDYFGNIVAVEYEAVDEWMYGILAEIKGDEDEDCVTVRLYDSNGIRKKYDLGDKVIIDGTAYKTNRSGYKAKIIAALQRGDTYQCIADATNEHQFAIMTNVPEEHVYQLIRYKSDDENILEIDTTYKGSKEANESLRILNFTDADGNYIINTQTNRGIYGAIHTSGYERWGIMYGINSSTQIYDVPNPDNINNDDSYKVRMVKDMQQNERSYFIPYGVSYNDIAAIPMAVRVGYSLEANISDSASFCMVKEITDCLNKDDEGVTIVKLFEDGIEKELESDGIINISAIKRGDIIRYGTNTEGKINQIQHIYSAKSRALVTKLSDIPWIRNTSNQSESFIDEAEEYSYMYESDESHTGALLRTIISKCYTKFGGSSRFGLSSVYAGETSNRNEYFKLVRPTWIRDGKDIVENYNLTNFDIVVYNEADKTVQKGTIDDMRDYKSYGPNCSTVFMVTSYSEHRIIYIYNFK
mgnify:CR=1 FL=1